MEVDYPFKFFPCVFEFSLEMCFFPRYLPLRVIEAFLVQGKVICFNLITKDKTASFLQRLTV